MRAMKIRYAFLGTVNGQRCLWFGDENKPGIFIPPGRRVADVAFENKTLVVRRDCDKISRRARLAYRKLYSIQHGF